MKLIPMNSDETELALRDSLHMENCKTANELHYAIRNIEARHVVEGITPMNLAAWENVKRQHIERVYKVAAA